tara:strand:+ start:50 stop:229 length:180 start_codon:yes stop_codon:yes gene_type:complete
MPFVVKVDKSTKPPRYRIYNKDKKQYVNRYFKSRETANNMIKVYDRYAGHNKVINASNK